MELADPFDKQMNKTFKRRVGKEAQLSVDRQDRQFGRAENLTAAHFISFII